MQEENKNRSSFNEEKRLLSQVCVLLSSNVDAKLEY